MRYLFIIVLFLIPIFFISRIFYNEEDTVQENTVENINNEYSDLEDYIVGVVACEMPASFEYEALKAMAVAARTFSLNKLENNPDYNYREAKNDQCYNDKTEMQNKWGKDYEKYYNKIKNAVEDTKGMYISYNNEPIESFYFSTSNGYTENVENVFKEKIEYLISVSSPWDVETKNFEKTISYSETEFLKLLKINANKVYKIDILGYTGSNRVEKILINNKTYTGIEFRKLLNLRSTDFIVKETDNKINITTKGYGHGVGMSQYGANGMAKEGKKYTEILKYYYQNVEIKEV